MRTFEKITADFTDEDFVILARAVNRDSWQIQQKMIEYSGNEQGICPVCHGSKRMPAGDNQYKAICAGYDKTTDTFRCDNCGGQTMYVTPTGQVPLRPDGVPCKHQYEGKQLGNCYWQYTCVHGCGHVHCIDSGD